MGTFSRILAIFVCIVSQCPVGQRQTSNLLKHVKSRHSDVYEAELTRLNDKKAHALKSNTPITSFAVSLPQPSHSKSSLLTENSQNTTNSRNIFRRSISSCEDEGEQELTSHGPGHYAHSSKSYSQSTTSTKLRRNTCDFLLNPLNYLLYIQW